MTDFTMILPGDIALTPDEAKEKWACPVARIFASKSGPNCDGESCAMWRWRQRKTIDPGFKQAMKDAIKETGEHHTQHPEAAALVAREPERFGLGPERGYCGLGGACA